MKWADLTATNGQFSRPPVGSYVTAYEHFSMAADNPDGQRRTAPQTFSSKTLARRWLSVLEADMVKGLWRKPDVVVQPLRGFAVRWVAERSGLSERTKELYEGLLKRHVLPVLGDVDLRSITPARVRSWRQSLLDRGVGGSTVAKAYRLLRSILNTAVEDEVIARNPCRIKGGGVETTPERPIATLAEVVTLAEAIEPRYRVLVLLSVFGSLRWGELMGLQREDVDLDAGLVRVERSVAEVGSRLVTKAPKSAAGARVVAVPRWLVPELSRHLLTYSEVGSEGRVFVGSRGATPYRRNFARTWSRAKSLAGVQSDLHFHDLRHTGNHFAAASGASTRELMGRMGHASMRAALIYQHRTRERDRAIADSLDALIRGSE
ncbi:MAG TPA: tyrosine-type recombinase/integrase [Propionibacteriaceae bacterium]|nr:tyrosine-type recombinase/integrase [Propionibacteriaceae bacterium]